MCYYWLQDDGEAKEFPREMRSTEIFGVVVEGFIADKISSISFLFCG
jgi:hypothetical protein